MSILPSRKEGLKLSHLCLITPEEESGRLRPSSATCAMRMSADENSALRC